MDVRLIAGVDDVGRGPLAGPVIAAAVILNPGKRIRGLADSKKLTEKRRTELAEVIQEKCLAFAFGRAEVEEIDRLNIFHAGLLAMKRAIEGLSVAPNHVLVDGTHCPELSCTAEAIIKGDQKIPAISAASIIAKVMRDQEMTLLDQQYPGYGFADHKGYSTKRHFKALAELGPSTIHRRSFLPVRQRALDLTPNIE